LYVVSLVTHDLEAAAAAVTVAAANAVHCNGENSELQHLVGEQHCCCHWCYSACYFAVRRLSWCYSVVYRRWCCCCCCCGGVVAYCSLPALLLLLLLLLLLSYGSLGAPDGFMLTLTAAVLRLTKPFVSGCLTQNPKFGDLLTKHLNPSFYASHKHRLGGAVLEATLSGQAGGVSAAATAANSQQQQQQQYLLAADPAAAAGAASFISEVFFLGQRYLHVGLMPAVHR
jgi:hypothetical protein